MKSILKTLSVASLVLVFSVLFGSLVLATPSLSGIVSDESDNPLVGTIVEVVDHTTHNVLAHGTTNAEGKYDIPIDPGNYDIRATPPTTSGFQPVTAHDQDIQGSRILDFIIARAGVITLSGRVTDATGNGVMAELDLSPAGFGYCRFSCGSLTTDESGHYSLQVSPGTYQLFMKASNGYSLNVPSGFQFIGDGPTLNLTQDTTLDLVLDPRRVDVHVEDLEGNPIAGASLQTSGVNFESLSVGSISLLHGGSGYFAGNFGGEIFPTTDSAGNATLWLFPTPVGQAYTILVTPSDGSDLARFSLQGLQVTSNKSLIISLQVPSPFNTPSGSNVTVSPSSETRILFSEVTNAGNTTVSTTSTGPVPPSGFNLGDVPIYYDIVTTAVYNAPVSVCLTYDPSNFEDPTTLTLFHYESSTWVNVTTSNDTNTNIICGEVNSLSPFVVAQKTPFTFLGFYKPVDNLPIINVLKAGQAIPIKWSLKDSSGNFVSDLAVVESYEYTPTDCTTGKKDKIEKHKKAKADSLKYDSRANQFVLTSKTDKSWKSSCKMFSLLLSDGTVHQATFEFK